MSPLESRILGVLGAVVAGPPAWSSTTIAHAVHVHPRSCHRWLRWLRRWGFVDLDEAGRIIATEKGRQSVYSGALGLVFTASPPGRLDTLEDTPAGFLREGGDR